MIICPRTLCRYEPQGWVQAEFSPVPESGISRAKEEVRRLEEAWQLRISMDTGEAERNEASLSKIQVQKETRAPQIPNPQPQTLSTCTSKASGLVMTPVRTLYLEAPEPHNLNRTSSTVCRRS